jgi:N-acetylglucosaminyldiphosphoundecaprenol N-acetyl-beta-D-mannosaminyltransferase
MFFTRDNAAKHQSSEIIRPSFQAQHYDKHRIAIPHRHSCTRLFGLDIHNMSFAEANQHLLDVAADRQHPARVVVTPNVDHVVRLDSQPEFKQVYSTSDYIFADGMPVVWASKMSANPLPERVTGADLFVSLCKGCVEKNMSIFVVGGMPGRKTCCCRRSPDLPGIKSFDLLPIDAIHPDGSEADTAIA